MKTVQSHFLLFCCVLLLAGLASPGYAQKPVHLQELEELLERYPEQPNAENGDKLIEQNRSIFSEPARHKIAEIDAAAPYTIVGQDGRWLLVRFNNPMVPLWVSDRFIKDENGMIEVTATRLNARLRPSATAPVISSVKRGYRTKVLNARNGFSQILVDSNVVVAIADEGKDKPKVAAASNAKPAPEQGAWSVANTPAADKALIASEIENQAQSQRSIQERQHLIAPGDAISLLVFGEPDLSIENVRVPESGRVSFPLIGSVSVGGQTTRQVENVLRGTLSEGYVKNPRLSVTIFSYRPIFIRGGVRSTGSFPYTEGLSVAKAIALAGGSKNSAKTNGVSILRDGETIETGLALDSQQKVASGDVITVAEDLGVGEDSTLFIYLHGEVANPGEYLYRRGLTVEKAIVLAGGFTLRGSSRKIKLTRYAGQGEDGEPIKLKGVKLYTPIEPGDVIKIGARWF